MAKTKQVPEDFMVKELTGMKKEESGDYAYFVLKKRGWNTLDAVNKISGMLKADRKRIGFAGNKDRNAVTEQMISFYKLKKENVEGLKIKDVELKFFGYGKERINLGYLEGNKFLITIRDMDRKIEKVVKQIPNYFDDQRFGINSINHVVGRCLVKKDFKQACGLLGIEAKGNDYVGSLRKIGRDKLRFFVGAYQSYLWNKFVSSIISGGKHFFVEYSLGRLAFPANSLKNRKICVPGFLHYKGYGKIFEEEGISRENFVIRQMAEISSEGTERDMVVKVKSFKTLRFTNDDLNEGKFKQAVSFALPKGAYATIVIKNLLGNA